MKYILLLCVIVVVGLSSLQAANPHDAEVNNNEFAEFEDFDEEDTDGEKPVSDGANAGPKEVPKQSSQPATADNEDEEEEADATVENEDDDEFTHFTDEDEFEGYDRERSPSPGKPKPELKIATPPLPLITNWDSFYLEILMLAGLAVYLLNFLAGKNKNHKLAQSWLNSHRDLLESNFHIVGDDGTSKEAQSGTLMKESENVYALWCSGRTCVEGMLVELKFLKRQDLVSSISRIFKPASDQIVVRVDMDPKVMDKFVFAIALKRSCAKLHKDMLDLSQFTEKKNTDRFSDIPSSYQLLSEIGEATNAILDKKVCQALDKYDGMVEYMHFSDQYSGIKNQEEQQQTKMPETKPILSFCFNVPGKGKCKPVDMEKMKPLLQLVFYCVDKISRLQLSKEARSKAEKNRQKAEELFLKAAHTQRQEAAQLRREEKRRVEKERLLNEEDPDKARKLEERESRRENKRKQPKMKMMKVKAM